MLLIPDETLDLIAGGYAAGGYAATTDSMPIVTVRPPDEGSGGIGWLPPWGDGGGEGSGTVSAPQPSPPPECPVIHSSPVPANAPKDVDMNTLRNTMLDVAAYIKTMDDSIEHGAIVLRASDGTLRVGEVRHGTPGRVDMVTYPLPGEVIVGYIHSHPDNGIDQTLPSRDDFQAAKELRSNPVADPGLMLYILDNKSGDVFEYHADVPHNTTKQGANITDDTSKDTSKPCG